MKYGKLATFLRGDFNASSKNKPRSAILSSVIARLSLNRVNMDHYSYHHFRGNGDSDSDLDLLLYGGEDGGAEHLHHIECKFVNPLLFSHHDLIVSECSIPPLEVRSTDESKNITAPRIENDRFNVKWSDDGIAEYSQHVTPLLHQIRQTWGSSGSPANISLLMSTTFSAMNIMAKATNKVTMLAKKFRMKPKTSPAVFHAASRSLRDLNHLNNLVLSSSPSPEDIDVARQQLSSSRRDFKKVVRSELAQDRDIMDSKLNDIISNPSKAFRTFRAAARSNAPCVKRLQVGDKVYSGDTVADGMFDSLNNLKAPNMEHYNQLPHYAEAVSTYNHIMKLALNGGKIPTIANPRQG